jgi:hypothetical protein
MPRTEQTARKSTGGKAPRKNLKDKAARHPLQSPKLGKFATPAASSLAVSIPPNPQVTYY